MTTNGAAFRDDEDVLNFDCGDGCLSLNIQKRVHCVAYKCINKAIKNSFILTCNIL